jgi:hypothetical protein
LAGFSVSEKKDTSWEVIAVRLSAVRLSAVRMLWSLAFFKYQLKKHRKRDYQE